MLFLFLVLIFAATAAGLWFQGTWSGAITLVNLLLAMIIASNFFEPVSSMIEGIGAAAGYTYLLDFVVLWLLFGITFAILRAITDALSKAQVAFDMPVEMAGRSVLAIICGWLMVVFVAFSLQMAPLNSPAPLGAFNSPDAKTFGPFAPDRMWLGFLHSRSQQALAGRAFDPKAEFPLKYHDRRVKYSASGTSMKFQR